MTVEEIEKLIRSKKSPTKLSAPDKMLHSELTKIAELYKLGKYTLEQAHAERVRAISFHAEWQSEKQRYADIMRQYTAVSKYAVRAEKDGCEICKEWAKVYDGRLPF